MNMLRGRNTVKIILPPQPQELCFTANTAGSTVQLIKDGTPTDVSLETSTDGNTWTDYTIGNTITLTNIGDKVYMRNKSETATGFSTRSNAYYQFVMTGSIAGSGDINYLLCKDSTDTLVSNYCYRYLFKDCTSLTTAPSLPATTLTNYCYYYMFNGCTGLITAPSLPATTLATYCYYSMFAGCASLTTLPELSATTLAISCYTVMFKGCTNIKLSEIQTGEYQTPYRMPTTGTGTVASDWNTYMFANTGGTFTGSPSINTTYYTSNTIV